MRVAGFLDLALGLVALVVGIGLVIGRGNREAVPLGLTVSVVAVLLVVSGLGRITARLEVHPGKVTWSWNFSHHQIPLAELEDAALVEKGSPAAGASWAGFLGGGFLSVLAWWLVDVAHGFFGSEPSLGSLDLVVIRHHGVPVEVKAISAWSTHSSHSQANAALRVLKAAIASSGHPPEPGPRILLHDEWETT